METLVANWSARPFCWGVTDCCQLAKHAVLTLHGVQVDHPPYSTEREALRVLQSFGGYRGQLALTHRQVPNSAAQRGDIAIVSGQAPFGEALAVVTATHAHTTGPTGLVAVPRAQWVECWRVL